MKRLARIALAALVLAGLANAGQSAPSSVAVTETPPQVQEGTAKLVGHYDPGKMLRVVLALQPPHMVEEEQFLEELHTKGSPNFHHFLTAAEWDSRFAPSAADEQAVVDWAESVGFAVTHRYPNRLLVDVEAPVGTIEAALGVTINHYQVGGETLFSNDRDPVIPASLARIIHSVQGLNNIQRMHPALRGTHDFPGPDYSPGPVVALGPHLEHDGDRTKLPRSMGGKAKDGPSMTNGFYDPTDIYSSQAYDYNGLHAVGHCCNPNGNPYVSPPDSSIAIAAFGVPSNNDLNGFYKQYPYLAMYTADVFIDGTYQCAMPTDVNCSEATLDTEWSVATSNSFDVSADTAAVWLYAGANENNGTFTDVYNQMLIDGHARVFSTSWGCTEVYGCSAAVMDSRHAIFNEMLGQGWTLVAAAGDNGASADCYIPDNPAHTSVDYPASDPDVVGAGGTTLDLNFDGTYNSEVAWQGGTYPGACFKNDGGTGGGFSAYYQAPIWMATGPRPVPDLSLNADPAHAQNYYYNGELLGVGGTSIVAPELAGFFAQENAYLLYLGNMVGVCHFAGPGGGDTQACAPMGQANYYLWWVGFRPKEFSHYPFYNITSGCNSNDVTAADSLTYYCANPGYSLVTGWGTANMLQLAWAINEFLAGDGGYAAVNFSGPPTGQWYNYYPTVTWTLTNITCCGFPANGFAGFSDAWDVDPGDSSSEATPGGGNSFYTGPQVPHFTVGSLSLGGVAQGCHTAHVRAWDNAGWGSGDRTFGPLCLDTIPPAVSLALSPAPNAAGWFNSPVQVTLSASDPGANSNPATGSGVASTYYGVDAPGCQTPTVSGCAVYGSPFYISTEGRHALQFVAQDVAGNFSLAQPGIPANIDETPPTTRALLTGNVRVGLIATDNLSGVASTVYQLDGGTLTAYTLPFIVSTKGQHAVTFHSTDWAGNVEATKTATFTVQ